MNDPKVNLREDISILLREISDFTGPTNAPYFNPGHPDLHKLVNALAHDVEEYRMDMGAGGAMNLTLVIRRIIDIVKKKS